MGVEMGRPKHGRHFPTWAPCWKPLQKSIPPSREAGACRKIFQVVGGWCTFVFWKMKILLLNNYKEYYNHLKNEKAILNHTAFWWYWLHDKNINLKELFLAVMFSSNRLSLELVKWIDISISMRILIFDKHDIFDIPRQWCGGLSIRRNEKGNNLTWKINVFAHFILVHNFAP